MPVWGFITETKWKQTEVYGQDQKWSYSLCCTEVLHAGNSAFISLAQQSRKTALSREECKHLLSFKQTFQQRHNPIGVLQFFPKQCLQRGRKNNLLEILYCLGRKQHYGYKNSKTGFLVLNTTARKIKLFCEGKGWGLFTLHWIKSPKIVKFCCKNSPSANILFFWPEKSWCSPKSISLSLVFATTSKKFSCHETRISAYFQPDFSFSTAKFRKVLQE